MNDPTSRLRRFLVALAFVACLVAGLLGRSSARAEERRLLYVATPGIRNYLEYGGHGLVVFDIDHGHKFVKRIKTAGLLPDGKPDNVKGVCASALTKRLYISTIHSLTCLDLVSEKILWEKPFEEGCDRMSISPDGKTIYLPSFEKDHWNALDASDGRVIAQIFPKSGSHNTVYGLDGKHAYLAGLRSPLLTVADAISHREEKRVGPFSASIRPFTVNGAQTRCYVTVNELLGFEIGDLTTGKKLERVEVQGYKKGPVKRHGCPSHGIGLTPDEKEIWVVDAFNKRVHLFDNTVNPPKQVASLELRDEPGWVTFTIDGQYAYPSTGDVFDVKTRKIVAELTDENGTAVHSEKMLEIDFDGAQPIRTGDQFGLGRVTKP
jgi:hypothetical protein